MKYAITVLPIQLLNRKNQKKRKSLKLCGWKPITAKSIWKKAVSCSECIRKGHVPIIIQSICILYRLRPTSAPLCSICVTSASSIPLRVIGWRRQVEFSVKMKPWRMAGILNRMPVNPLRFYEWWNSGKTYLPCYCAEFWRFKTKKISIRKELF